MTANRLYYLDNVKAIAAIAVIAGHSALNNAISPIYSMWCASWYVPVFFLISGILLEVKNIEDKPKYNVVKKIKTYIIPFYIFSFAEIAFNVLLQLIVGRFSLDYIISSMRLVLLGDGIGACWFLMCFFLVEIIFVFQLNHFKFLYILIVNTALAVILTTFWGNRAISVFLVQARVIVGLFIITIGYAFSKYKTILTKNNIILLLVVPLFIFIFIINPEQNMYNMNCGKYGFLYCFEILASSFIILQIVRNFLNKKVVFLSWFGKNTIISLTMHKVFVIGFRIVFSNMLPALPFDSILFSVFVFVSTMLLQCVAILVCNKWFMWIYGQWKLPEKNKMA